VTVFLLNESRNKGHMGDVSFYTNLVSLLKNIEAIDVRNGEYECYDSLGNIIILSAQHDYASVIAHSSDDQSHQMTAKNILDEFLNYLEKDGRFGVDKSTIDLAISLEDKFLLVPLSFFEM
jgi:hypothetical protein